MKNFTENFYRITNLYTFRVQLIVVVFLSLRTGIVHFLLIIYYWLFLLIYILIIYKMILEERIDEIKLFEHKI